MRLEERAGGVPEHGAGQERDGDWFRKARQRRRDGWSEQVQRERLETVATLLRDPDRTAFRVVLLPERLAVAESRRLVERLRAFEVPVGALVANRVLPEGEADCCERCRTRSERQAAALADVRETFTDLPLLVLPDLQQGTVGRAALTQLAGELALE